LFTKFGNCSNHHSKRDSMKNIETVSSPPVIHVMLW
jgi:hypothetical protein